MFKTNFSQRLPGVVKLITSVARGQSCERREYKRAAGLIRMRLTAQVKEETKHTAVCRQQHLLTSKEVRLLGATFCLQCD